MDNTPMTESHMPRQEAKTIVQLSQVRKSFNVGEPTEVEVLHGIDLVLRAGEFAAVMGPSGSGKSTLLNIVGLLDRPTQGQLQITGAAARAQHWLCLPVPPPDRGFQRAGKCDAAHGGHAGLPHSGH
jgi:ABC-type sugar transport system ATPase subunit